MLRQLIADNTPQDWVYALLAAAAFIVLLHFLRKLVLLHLQRIARSTDTVIDDFLVEVLSATRILLAGAAGLYLGTHFLSLPASLEKFVDRAFIAVIILQAGFWFSRGLSFWLKHRFSQGDKEDEGARAMTLSLLSFLGRVVVWVLVLLLILDNLGLNVTALVASLGIGGIAVALAAQNILGDLFASLSIAIDKPFVIGDFIIVDDMMGSVEHVGLKTTRLRSLGGEQIIFSNNDLLKCRIRNYKRMQERRALFAIGVTYDTPADKLEQIPALIQQAVEAQSDARFDRAHFKGFGAFSLDFEAVYYVLKPDYNTFMSVQQAINLQLVRRFADQGIEFAFPTQTLYLSRGASATKAEHPMAKKSQ
ncbi:MAG: mechanosensitive ion channel family protein [Gammaproteobacteria bacterium]|uniref:mechanosensitive ion channel family protein n=1 Tax=Rhodoferax sp. TaxID=50421 RepID=UPI0017C2C538|nr:mechanosensitive ion channel family protein [Rhodoferax sp.]MBU3900963.1 mechanosensitive ion channel family protein [Gammaproteobacteria bacterium]MBA3056476.1 mechanosensitive ion channel family protein [Rhodoferax sp.]MBU3996808.1 mechanosensitive ion channel family protein [Gammaproteobacteria bacterium]MBU4017637.1 mechanosensitive ion channel family protein [Gammaproteobacteria bacterium]MBU4081080.1 mechanosensitive ion channel family protein [Gammaproteobacteria bacterium]